MSTYSQAKRPLAVTTPLGEDKLLLVGFSGQEAISRPFNFHLDLLAENKTQVEFDKLLGQKITVQLALPTSGDFRYFSGICSRFSQAGRDAVFTSYRLEMVPQFWLLTHKAQSRTFQQKSVPDILKAVLAGIDASFDKLQGNYQPRDYCVQYRETDFNFASRLMEEEGIYYYFQHTSKGHTMVVGDTPQGHPDMPVKDKVIFDVVDAGHLRKEDRIHEWEKSQLLRSGKYTLWDHCFELPHKHLNASEPTVGSVNVGTVTHKLQVGGNDKLEIFDYPGEYAQRFDGIDPGGGDQSSNVQGIFKDNQRTVKIRMQEEALHSLLIHAAGGCRQWTSGYKFSLQRHFSADGPYVVTSVQHSAHLRANYRSGSGQGFRYHNSFTCIPAALPFRPPRVTPKPVIHGTQTAVVVGQPGDEIFTDKYGRVKVQFHWDRQEKNDAQSSCWVRVGSIWAGKQWGGIHIPRVGQEVVVAFEEGDPDRPIIIGGVYNAETMPPYTLPDNKTQSGVKSRSSLQGTSNNFNELRFEDKKGSEQVYFHAEKNFDRVVENNDTLKVGTSDTQYTQDGNRTVEIWNNHSLKVGAGAGSAKDGSQTIEVYHNRTETVKTGDELVTIEQGNRTVNVNAGNDTHNIKQGNRAVTIDMGNDSLTIKMGNQTTKLNLGASSTEAMQSIELKVGQSSVKVDQMGVTIQGMMIKINGQMQTQVQGLMTQIQGSAMTQISGAITMIG